MNVKVYYDEYVLNHIIYGDYWERGRCVTFSAYEDAAKFMEKLKKSKRFANVQLDTEDMPIVKFNYKEE